MDVHRKPDRPHIRAPLLRRLAQDRAGNTMALVAAGLVPLLAMVGGGVDMGRGYLSQSRLQNACDAGVLAARKRLGSAVGATGEVPADVATIGKRFFDLNFRDGAYGTEERDFEMTLEDDLSISGVAKVTVPTSIMRIFGFAEVPIEVTCQAKLNFSNTDVMMVLDTTGSMGATNAGDSVSKIVALRSVVTSFFTQLEAAKVSGTRIRYGFVPYAANVNVGYSLNSDWMVDKWSYQGRQSVTTTGTATAATTWTPVSGSAATIPEYRAATCPADTVVSTPLSTATLANGDLTGQTRITGRDYTCTTISAGVISVTGTEYTDYVYNWLTSSARRTWEYKPVELDVRPFKGAGGSSKMRGGTIRVRMGGTPRASIDMNEGFSGCIEERATYEIDDYDDVDFDRALDLDIDRVPTPGDTATQWRPLLHNISFERNLTWAGAGAFSTGVSRYEYDFFNAGWAGYSNCPAQARKLAPLSLTDLTSYLASLNPGGNTYHDIGMIWGGRLLSPTGIFASENGDVGGQATSRHLIFLTDGETAPLDVAYGAYGIEPLNQRRWAPGSARSLTETVENRFVVACREVRKRNITVWVVSFGMELNPVLIECAGAGHAFEARDAAQLNSVFSNIARAMGDLRISK
ncbi:MAG: pilus assembly protein TadG-related protein [Novosphingobium sp.]